MLSRGNSEFEIRNRSIVMKNENRNAVRDRNRNEFQMNKSTEVLAKQCVSEETLQLKREIGLFSAVNLIVGVMIGSGIFVSPAMALDRAGSVNLCLIIWGLCGMISLLGALCFAELGTVVPRSGAEYAYFQEAYGNLHKFWGPLPSFICSWVYVMVLRPSEVAVIILTFSEYVCQPLEYFLGTISEDSREIVKKLIAVLALGLLTYINFISVKLFVHIQNIFTVSKLMVCGLIIIVGIYALGIGNLDNISKGFENTSSNVRDISLAFYSCLWPYDGWSTVTSITEEVKNPERNILLSIIIAVPLVTMLYCMMNVAYMTVLTHDEMAASAAVAVTFGEKMLGVMSIVIPVGVALSTFGCALSIQFSVTRLCFVAGREGHMMEAFSYIHMSRLTPAPSVILQVFTFMDMCFVTGVVTSSAGTGPVPHDVTTPVTKHVSIKGVLSLIFVLAGEVAELIDFASFLIWTFYAIAMVALLVLRKVKKDVDRPFQVQFCIPIFMIFVSLFLILVPMITSPSPKYFIALGLIGVGVLVYIPVVYYKLQPLKLINKFTYCTQVLLQVVPPEKQPD